MNLLNIPKDWIPTLDEMVILDCLISRRLHEGTSQDYSKELRELQHKLFRLDGIFRAAEQPDWNSYIDMDLREVPEQKGKPPYPTDENGSFKI